MTGVSLLRGGPPTLGVQAGWVVAVAFTLVLWLSALVARGGGAVGGPLGTLAACLALHSLVRLALGPFAVALRIKGGERFVAAVYVASARASLGALPPRCSALLVTLDTLNAL